MLKQGKLINPEVRVETTNACNAACVICPRERMTRPVETMCYGFFTNLVDQALDLGASSISAFGFGEPLLDANLAEKLSYCSDHRLETFITTNGSLLTTSRSVVLLDAGLKNIRFSFHAIRPLDHERVHRRIKWLPVYRNFANFVQLNNLRGHPCKVHISCIPMYNESIEDIRRTWGGYSDYLEIWKPHNWGGMRSYRDVQRVKTTCGRPFNGPVQIQADGTVIPCCFLTNSEVILGNCNDMTMKDILTGWEYRRLQKAHQTGELDEYPCATCDQLNEEEESPLIYSNRDPNRILGKTSTCKISVA